MNRHRLIRSDGTRYYQLSSMRSSPVLRRTVITPAISSFGRGKTLTQHPDVCAPTCHHTPPPPRPARVLTGGAAPPHRMITRLETRSRNCRPSSSAPARLAELAQPVVRRPTGASHGLGHLAGRGGFVDAHGLEKGGVIVLAPRLCARVVVVFGIPVRMHARDEVVCLQRIPLSDSST